MLLHLCDPIIRERKPIRSTPLKNLFLTNTEPDQYQFIGEDCVGKKSGHLNQVSFRNQVPKFINGFFKKDCKMFIA
jgi:hypothetical protein